jgi:poly(beta-D-mannuronate) lyase
MDSELKDMPRDLDMSGISNVNTFNDIDEFLNAVRDANAGDLIILTKAKDKDEYTVDKDKETTFTIEGEAERPVIVMAQEPGKVILAGSAGYIFDKCKYLTWYGFKHLHEGRSQTENISFRSCKNTRFARCEVALKDIIPEEDKGDPDKDKRHWLHLNNCEGMIVDHCYFHDKNSRGQFCNVRGKSDNAVGEGPLFEYNRFEKHTYVDPQKPGDSGGEAIQMGESTEERYYFRTVLRYNYFEECNGDPEIVTNKSSGNLYFNNSFVKNLGSLTLRHGDSTAVLANYFEASGLRVGGAYNLITNNHFTRNSANKKQRSPLVLHNGDEEEPKKGSWERVIDNHIILNTFDNGEGTAPNIVYWGEDKGYKPIGTEFRGNIITARNGKLLGFDNEASASDNTIADNIAWKTGNAEYGEFDSRKDPNEKMAIREDPLLTPKDSNLDGVYRLQNDSSPACKIFKGKGELFKKFTTVDIYGVTRIGDTHAGCYQYTTESEKPKKRITKDDVGLDAWTSLGDSPSWPLQAEM